MKKYELLQLKQQFPLLLKGVGNTKLKMFIMTIRKDPIGTKTVFMVELAKRERNMEKYNQIIDELDGFILKIQKMKIKSGDK